MPPAAIAVADDATPAAATDATPADADADAAVVTAVAGWPGRRNPRRLRPGLRVRKPGAQGL